jgi:hypothetical protein
MLDVGNEQSVSGAAWDGAELTAVLPDGMADFFASQGPTAVHPDCRRAYRRIYLRGKAIVQLSERSLGVYTVDASRKGIRFYSPIQLLPKLRVGLRIPTVKEMPIEIVRCRRVKENCYDCGAVFVIEPGKSNSNFTTN